MLLNMEEIKGWMMPHQIVGWAKANLNIMKLNDDMTDEEIGRVGRWIGACSIDTIYVDGEKPRLGRIGINNMLFVTLMEFPEFYVRFRLAQHN
jgi:hypothetical protein